MSDLPPLPITSDQPKKSTTKLREWIKEIMKRMDELEKAVITVADDLSETHDITEDVKKTVSSLTEIVLGNEQTKEKEERNSQIERKLPTEMRRLLDKQRARENDLRMEVKTPQPKGKQRSHKLW